jgi:hypothetical protein
VSDAAGAAGKAPIDLVVEAQLHKMTPDLTRIAGRRGFRGEDAADAIGDAFRIAFQRERTGKGERWVPAQPFDPASQAARESVIVHVAKILVDIILANRRRSQKRKPTDPLDDDRPLASDVEPVDVVLGDVQERDRRSAEVRSTIAAETKSGLSLRVFDALRAGMSGYDVLVDHLECTSAELRAAMMRITRRAKKVYAVRRGEPV